MIPKNCILYASDLEEIKTITFCISIPYYFTGNMMYKTQKVGNRVWVRKADEVIVLQRHIEAEIYRLGVKAPKDIYCYEVYIAFCSSKNDWFINNNTRLRKIDLTNIWKPIEDAIFNALNIDDSLGVHISLSKCLLPKQIDDSHVAVFITFYRLKKKGTNDKT